MLITSIKEANKVADFFAPLVARIAGVLADPAGACILQILMIALRIVFWQQLVVLASRKR